MRTYVLDHLNDATLLQDLHSLVAQERTVTAAVLAHIAEVDARRLYLPAGYPSMYEYCVGQLRLSEQAAMKRIRAGRAARRFPAIFEALADGRLHLSAVVLLAPYLTPENAGELLGAAEHRTKAEIESLLARRFPRPDLPARLESLAPPPSLTLSAVQLSPGTVEPREAVAPARVESRVAPLSAERFALQFTISRATRDKLRHVQALLSHRLPSGDVADVFDRALDALTRQLEKRKLAATAKPRRSCRQSSNPRCIPAHVKRAVWERDGGQCTFVGDDGHRCGTRRMLEDDHVHPVARGGRATVDGLRLRCRGHNQYEAERVFGAGFMSGKREEARHTATERRERGVAAARTRGVEAAQAPARAAAPVAPRADADSWARDLTTCLRELGFRATEAREAVAHCATIPAVGLEDHVRAALKFLCPKALREAAPAAASA